tara:strand:- start:68066 stop:69316 length:1251 start_codon:yes stop_codon:yes gene_type:complete
MTKKKKINVLVIPSDRTGVSYFRSTNPHIRLENNYPDEFRIDIDYEPKIDDENWLKQYDIIHYHRTIGDYDLMEKRLAKIKALGILTVMDLDDYWSPGKHHPAYLTIKSEGLDKKILNNIKLADNIITTTSIFKDELIKFNKNIHILPNSIDPTEKQYMPNPEPSNRLRIGWLGGSSHLEDLKLLEGLVGKIKSDGLLDKVQFVLCGFDLRGNKIMINEKTGEKQTRPITPKESVWYKYEQIFTNDYKAVSDEYRKFLLKFKKEKYPDLDNEPYRRVWTKPISTYAMNYNLFDVSIAPLSENTFNKVKSQLKVIEAGFHKKAIIAQDYGPYNIDLKNIYDRPKKGEQIKMNDDGNALLVTKNKNHRDWYRNVKRLIQNPELVETLRTRLYETVKDKYNIDEITKQRRDLYIKLLNK